MKTVEVTAQEVVQYFQSLLKRAWVNLGNAEARKDHRAVNNIKRKISIYAWVIAHIENK